MTIDFPSAIYRIASRQVVISPLLQHRTLITVHRSWLEEKQIKALHQGPRYGRSLESDVEMQWAFVQRCIERLQREAIARTESNTERIINLATHVESGTSEIQADARKIKKDCAISRTGIAHMEAIQASLTAMIQKMQNNIITILQDQVKNKECKYFRSADYPIFWHLLGHCRDTWAIIPELYTLP